MTLRQTLFIVTLFGCIIDTISQNSYSLKEALDYAQENHYKIKNADIDIVKAKKKIWETTAIGLPQADAQLQYQNQIDLAFEIDIPDPIPPGQEFLLTFAAQHNTSASFTVSQLIFDGTYFVGLQAAKQYKALTQKQKEKTVSEVRNEVANNYYLALIAAENLNVLESSKGNIESNIKETKALFEVGFLEETDVDQLELLKANIDANIENSKNQLNVAQMMLQLSMGLSASDTIVLSDSLEGIIDQINTEQLLSHSFTTTENPDFQVLEVQEELQLLDIRRYQAQRLPSIAGFYQASAQSFQTEFDFYKEADWLDAQTAGLSINVPILSFGMQKMKIDQAKLELEKVQNSKVFFEEQLKVQYQNALNAVQAKLKAYENAKRSLEIAEKIQGRTEIKHKEGLASSFDLLQSKNQVLESQGQYINSLFQLLQAKANLDQLQNKN